MLNHFDEYLDRFVQVSSRHGFSGKEQYKNVMESLADVVADIDHFYEKDPQTGAYKNPLTAENLEQIQQKYSNLGKQLKEFRETLSNSEASRMAGSLSGLEDIVQKDSKALSSVFGTGKTYLPDALESGRKIDAYFPDWENQATVGYAQSTRRPISFTDPSGKEVTGFFTEESKIDPETTPPMLMMLNPTIGSSIPDRNVGMSRVAELLGVSSVLALSKKMEVTTNEGKKSGVFMETAAGTDLDNITRSEASKLDNISFSDKALREINDLQMLDSLCTNNDRHAGNLICDFKPGKDGKMVLDGVRGIDNDSSFAAPGVIAMSDDQTHRGLVGLNQLQFCSQGMADKLMSLNKDTFQLAFQDLNLSKEEKEFAWNRIEKVQDKINKKEITVVKDGEWGKIPKEQLFTHESSFKNIQDKAQLLYEESSKEVPKYADFKKTDSPEISYTKADNKGNIHDVKQQLDQFAAEFSNTEGFFKGESKRYKEMKKALKEAKKAYKDTLDGKGDGTYQDKLKALEEKVNAYVDYKKDNLNGNTAEQRFSLASKLQTALKQNHPEKSVSRNPIAEPKKNAEKKHGNAERISFKDLVDEKRESAPSHRPKKDYEKEKNQDLGRKSVGKGLQK